MLFNSPSFAVFFPIVTALYFLLNHRYRWSLLLLASCWFYMAFVPKYILILFFLILVDYVAGILIEDAPKRKKKPYLILSLLANIGVLAFFKYFNFLNENLAGLAKFLDWQYSISSLSILLPIGLSFHTFQSMSYTIEVYRGHKAERHLGIYALYVLFYPQLVAGPIERPQNLLGQFRAKHYFEYDRVVDGLKLMLGGFLKKVVIADRLALVVNQVYNSPRDYQGIPLIIATVFFAFQIFCDFSGYSDIARGAAKVMGFDLMVNFDRPYLSKSISEFWKRWHISLSTWFRDYLYIPLGGNRVSEPRRYFNLFFVFLVSGFWHGANWTFIIWGAIHGAYLVGAQFFQKFFKKTILPSSLQMVFTFALVCLAWVFFRANSVSDGAYIIRNLFRGLRLEAWESYRLGIPLKDFFIAIGLVGGLMVSDFVRVKISDQPLWVRWGMYYTAAVALVFLGQLKPQQFIYFQF